MPSISYVAYGDLGSQTGQAIDALATGFHEYSYLTQIYCRGVEESVLPSELVRTPIPFERLVPKLLTGVNRFVAPKFHHRYYSELIFDYYTAKQIGKSDVHYHHSPGKVWTLDRGLSYGSKVIVKAVSEHRQPFNTRLEKEYRRLGIDSGISKRMNARASRREYTLQNCDEIHALSGFVKQSLVNNGIPNDKITVTHLGVNADDYPTSPWNPSNLFTVLYVGSITVSKGIPYLLDAWERNGWGGDSDARLILCGRPSPQMKTVLQKYDFENLELPGYVDPRDYHQRASVFAFPSLSEGFAKAPMEAMAAGLPTIVSDHTGVNEIMSDGEDGYVIPAGDSDVLAKRLRDLRNNVEEQKRMGESGLKTAESQTWDNHVDQVCGRITDN
ncbi:glycosyltransferase family 4 protein [Haloarcula laminariae]|uniref:glycosyltransferase family 4 protein n=1 Tax=Haloarcula laminariae TaxID=2961577 RepID=UPI0024072158|nr:glycosyltransferase family 4 protein [Halomicroarcula sp. FL173]